MSMQKTNTEALRRQIAHSTGVSLARVTDVLQTLALIIGDDLAEGRSTRLEGIGTFSAAPKEAREGVAPSGAHYVTTGGLRIKFKASQDLKRRVKVLDETD